MQSTLVVYASKHGQTQKIAERIAAELSSRGQHVSIRNLLEKRSRAEPCPPLERYAQAIIVAPLYAGRYPRAVRRFVEQQAEQLSKVSATFASVSLTQATVQDTSRTLVERREAEAGLADCIDAFSEQTGFRPQHVVHFAGALAYTKYGPVVRWLMKRIARKAGASIDTSRDHELTDWDALTRWVSEVLLAIEHAPEPQRAREELVPSGRAAMVAAH